MKRVRTGLSWLFGSDESFGKADTQSKSYRNNQFLSGNPADKEISQSSVFISLPKKGNYQKSVVAAHVHREGLVYSEKPGWNTFGHSLSQSLASEHGAGNWFSFKLLPFSILLATVFAATGMLRIMVRGVDLPTYYPAGYLKTQSWRSGAGPSPLDAIKNEYQNALTKEMVSASDTGAAKAEVKKTKKIAKKGPNILVTASSFNFNLKSGIKNIKLKVFNGTESTLERVSVAVDFMDRDGKVIKTESFSTTEIASMESKYITIPEGMPGKKIKYRINEVHSKNHTTVLQEL